MLRAFAVFAALLATADAAMAGTNAHKLRRPVVHRGAAGTVAPARAVPSIEEALFFAKQHRKAFTHKKLVKKIAANRACFPMQDVQACIDSSANGNEVEECFLPGETEADGWAM